LSNKNEWNNSFIDGAKVTDPVLAAIIEKNNITVIITTFERPDFLETALESVLSQTVSAVEIIIVNDCSEADYTHVISRFTQPNIRYINLENRSGANVARNIGVHYATGNIIAFLDDDDIWLKNYLENHAKIYSDYPDTGAVVCGHRVMHFNNKVNVNSLIKVTADELRHGNRFSGMSGFSAKIEVLHRHSFDQNLKNGQDWDLFVRIIQDNIIFRNIPTPLFLYRKDNPGGISNKVIEMEISEAEMRLQSSEKHREWLGEEFYKKRVSEQILALISYKRNKLAWLKKSIELAGLSATTKTLIKQVIRKLKS
tara:strand:+ start:330 stop:1265 length:936 start_codon:yes stop_codon:yes gene_type:complete